MEKSAWRLAWEWASSWRDRTTFAVVQFVIGAIGFFVVLSMTGEAGWAFGAATVSAAVTFVVGVVWKVVTIALGRRREFQAAVMRIAARSPETGSGQSSTGPSPDQSLKRFKAYVDNQLVKLLDAQSVEEWSSFTAVAVRTAEGIDRFDSSLGQYVRNTFLNDWGEPELTGRAHADRVIDAVLEAKDLYDGGPSAPF
jgi:hypothetical protein